MPAWKARGSGFDSGSSYNFSIEISKVKPLQVLHIKECFIIIYVTKIGYTIKITFRHLSLVLQGIVLY